MTPFEVQPEATGEWECMECGYIEDGTKSLRPAKCPECSAPASSLEFFALEDEEEWGDSEDEFADHEDDYDDFDEEWKDDR
jgi:hypothetical protein